ncbi:MAG: hypothetical protein GF417_07685 [Candidatus Latescibacteria bacterium]|nr:hypothetical protein [bacterium]MBD3424300.1 hypothetical protein [Candidatus Latescibacterota bacterium]
MFNSTVEEVCLRFAVLALVSVLAFTGTGCDEGRAPVAEPEVGPPAPAEERASAGELHNMIVRNYLDAVMENGRLAETGGRIPWNEARELFLSIGNDLLREHQMEFRLTEELLESSMRQLVSMKKEGVMDVFYPGRNRPFPSVLEEMARTGLVSRDQTVAAASFWNCKIERKEEEEGLWLTSGGEFELEEDVLSVIEHSHRFWAGVTGEDIVGREDEEEESEDSFWDNIKDWWLRNRKDIRRITITSCDAGGAVVGSGMGPAGVVAGSLLASTGATIAWPPYDDIAAENGGELNCVAK